MSAAPAGAETGCALAGSWNQTTEEVGSTTWVIEANGSAQEFGIGNAKGAATLSNDTLKINWGVPDREHPDYAGVYEWKLNADCTGKGTLTFTKTPPGDGRENHPPYPSTVTGPPPIACRAAADRTLARAPACKPDTRVVFGFEARKLPDPKDSSGDGDIVHIEAQGAGKRVQRFSGSGGTAVNERWTATIAIEASTTGGDDLTVLKFSDGRYEDERDLRAVRLDLTVKRSTLKGCKDGEDARGRVVEILSHPLDQAYVNYCGRELYWTEKASDRFHATVSKPKPIPGPV
jgi:hypothetical protein